MEVFVVISCFSLLIFGPAVFLHFFPDDKIAKTISARHCPQCGIKRLGGGMNGDMIIHRDKCSLCGWVSHAKYSRHTGTRGKIGHGDIKTWGLRGAGLVQDDDD